MSRFANQTVLITGGSSGIGRATAERLAEEGATVIITGTNADKLAAVADNNSNITAHVNDAGDPHAASALGGIAKAAGGVDAVFLNAGYGIFRGHHEVTAEDFADQYNVNVRGPMLQMAALSPYINDGGSVLITTSVAQEMGLEGGSLYATTKGAVHTYVRVLAKELAGRNIRVNAVSPGPIGSDFFDRTGMPAEDQDAMADGIVANVPLGRFGTPEEVAAVSAFLLSHDASYVTGAEFVVDGGMTGI